MYLVKFSDSSEAAVEIRQSSTRRGRWEAKLSAGKIIHLTMKGRDDDGNYVIAIDGTDTSVSLRPTKRGYEVTLGHYSEFLSVSRAADVVFDQSEPTKTRETTADTELQSPITGIVLDVFVTPGQPVSPGDPVILIEAMKMENTLEANSHCTVDAVHVKPGDTVFVGDPLVAYAKPTDGD